MTPEILKNNFIQVDFNKMKEIILEKDNSEKSKFIYKAFKAFLPLTFEADDLMDGYNTFQEVYYQVVPLESYDLFIGLLYNLSDESVYIFNAKSCEASPGIYVTLANILRNSKFLTIKSLLNLMAESLLL